MLKIIRLFENLASKAFKVSNNDIIGNGNSIANKKMRNCSQFKMLKNNKFQKIYIYIKYCTYSKIYFLSI